MFCCGGWDTSIYSNSIQFLPGRACAILFPDWSELQMRRSGHSRSHIVYNSRGWRYPQRGVQLELIWFRQLSAQPERTTKELTFNSSSSLIVQEICLIRVRTISNYSNSFHLTVFIWTCSRDNSYRTCSHYYYFLRLLASDGVVQVLLPFGIVTCTNTRPVPLNGWNPTCWWVEAQIASEAECFTLGWVIRTLSSSLDKIEGSFLKQNQISVNQILVSFYHMSGKILKIICASLD